MKTKRTAPAFTLVEMLLVLVLSTIVITIAYAVYTNVLSLTHEYDKRTTDATERISLDQHLRHDANKASNLAITPESITLLDETATPIAQYTLNPAGLRRITQNQNDNFNVPIRGIHSQATPLEKQLILIIGPAEIPPDTYIYHVKPIPSAQISSSNSAYMGQ